MKLLLDLERLRRQRNDLTDFEGYAHPQLFLNPMSRWALAPVFQLLDIRREPGLLPFGTQFVSLEDSDRCAKCLPASMPLQFSIHWRFHKSSSDRLPQPDPHLILQLGIKGR
jgi:hypothetical protein